MYYAKEIEQITQKGGWKYTKIGIFRKEDDQQVGEFERNYGSFGVETFAPFVRGTNWYALYSKRYTGLSVMSLPSCEHLGSEATEADSFGFCPVEVYIPRFQWLAQKGESEEEMIKNKIPEGNWHWVSKDRYTKEYDRGDGCFTDDINDPKYNMEKEVFYENYAFVSGCVWGDDSSWKIGLRDISKAHEGIITNIEKWEHLELARNLSLKEAIHLSAFSQYTKEENTNVNITMAISKTIRLCKDGSIKDFD